MGAANKLSISGFNDRLTKQVHNLSDRTKYPKVHRFISSINSFAIHSNVPISQNQLIEHNGQLYKIAGITSRSIEQDNRIPFVTSETVYYEVRTACFYRQSSKG